MKLTDWRPRLHLIGLGGIALITIANAVENWLRWRETDLLKLKAQLDAELTNGPVADRGQMAFQAPECDCLPTQLEADIFQAGEGHWNWRIYTMGCNEVPSEYALGTSDGLDQAQADVLETMSELLEDADYELGELDFRVLHHVCAEVR